MIVGEKGYIKKAYVYYDAGSGWSCTDILVGPGISYGDSVAVYDSTIVVSNPDYDVSSLKGAAFIYRLISGKIHY